MAKNTGLGKGLDALIRPNDGGFSSTGGDSFGKKADVQQVEINKIVPNPRQPRKIFKEDDLKELSESIQEHGIIQPLLVTNGVMIGEYTLIAGERRLQASKLAGLETVPVIMRQTTDQELLELAIIENVQRSDLSPLESAEAYHQLSEIFGLSHGEIAKRVGKSRVAITNTIGLLDLSEEVKEALLAGAISEGHARALKSLEIVDAQEAALASVIQNNLNVRQTEELIRKLKGNKPASIAKVKTDPEVQEVETKLSEALSTKVILKHGKKGGSITIHYYSDEELNTLLDLLLQ
jgi:ParB family chromosome partitioning protein